MAYDGPLWIFVEKSTGKICKIDSSNTSDENKARLAKLEDTSKYTKSTSYDPEVTRWEDIVDADYDAIEGA